MTKKKRTRYGLILIEIPTHKVLILRRCNYALYNFINNNSSVYKNTHKDVLLTMYPGQFHESMYEFPKGVKEKKESGLDCAVREFFEETDIKLDSERLDLLTEISQCYTGKNNKIYLCIYYVVNVEFENDYNFSSKVFEFKNHLPVLGDNFNVLVCTYWDNVRDYFVKSNFNDIVTRLDSILYNARP